MEKDLQITFHGMAPSEAVANHIRDRVAKLERVSNRVTRCHVTVEIPHRHHRHGKHYRVCIELSVPGRTLVVSRDPEEKVEHEELHAAIDDAFVDARRVLEDWARVRRGDVKRHREGAALRR